MKVKEWLKRYERVPVTAAADWTLEQAANALLDRPGVRDLFLIDDQGRLIGHVSLRRIAQLLLAEHLPFPSRRQLMERIACGPVQELMDPHVTAASLEEEVDDVLHRLIEQGLEDLPVVDASRRLVGVVNLSTVLRALRPSASGPLPDIGANN